MRPLKLLDIHIFRHLVGPFVFGLIGALIIIAFGPLNKAVKFLVAGTIPPSIVIEWFLFRVPEDMQFIFPVATLMAGLLGFAGLSRNGELTAMRASGISLLRLLVPVVAFGVLATGGTYLFLNRLVPPAMVRSQDLWIRHFRNTLPPTYQENLTLRSGNGRLISVGQVNLKDPILLRLTVRDYPEGTSGPIHRTSARQAVWDPHRRTWVLEDARVEVHHPPSPPWSQGRLETRTAAVMELPLEEAPEVFQRVDRTPQEQTPEELLTRIRELEERGLANTLDLRVELYLKFSFPFCVLVFSILGATMGITNARSGGFMGFGVALILTFVYYVTMSLSASLGKSGMIDPLLSAWLHNLLFGSIALAKAMRASGG